MEVLVKKNDFKLLSNRVGRHLPLRKINQIRGELKKLRDQVQRPDLASFLG